MMSCVPFKHSPLPCYLAKPTFLGFQERDLEHLHNTKQCATLTTTTSSLYKKTFGSKSNATVLDNGIHLRKDFEILLYT